MSNLSQAPADWLKEIFEFELCEECSGDAQHHTAIPFLGNWFARCNHAPAPDGTPHPAIVAYLRSAGYPVTTPLTETLRERRSACLASARYYQDRGADPYRVRALVTSAWAWHRAAKRASASLG